MGAAEGGVELEITDLARDGRGVGRIDGEVVFVEGGLPGDRALVRLTARARGHRQGRVERLLRASPERRRPPCILADHCGGCSLQPLQDGAQAAWKHRHVVETLRRVGGVEAPVRPLLASSAGLGYRNRTVIPLERTGEGRLRAGFYRRGSHRIVNMNRCPVLDPRIDALIAPLKQDLEATGWPVDRHGREEPGGLRHLALRVGVRTGEILLTLVARHGELPGLEDLAERWRRTWPAVVGVGLNLQREPTNLLMGPHTRTVSGRDWLREEFCGLGFRIAADTFFQVHTPQAERVVPLLLEALGEGGPGGQGISGDLVVDAFCGIGTFSLPLAAGGWRVVGIEQQERAVQLARANAAANGLAERAVFEAAPMAAVLPERLRAADGGGIRALLVDPPRRGLEPEVLAAIRALPPPKLLYLSCDAATLARDLGGLCGAGPYRVAWLQPIDFFPNTTHVETLAVLERS